MDDKKPKQVLLIHKRDGSIVRTFDSEGEAARELERDRRSLVVTVRDCSIQLGPHLVRLKERWHGREDFDKRAHNRPVIVQYGGRLLWFDSAKSAAAGLGISYDGIHLILKDKVKSRRGIRARYALSTDDWPLLRQDMEDFARQGIEPEDPLALGKPAYDAREKAETDREVQEWLDWLDKAGAFDE